MGEPFLAAIEAVSRATFCSHKGVAGEVSAVQTEVIATPSGSPPRFTEIELCVSAECADRELLEKLVEIAERGCIMMNTLRGKLDLQVRIDTRV
jgi:putative redox protein